MAKTLILFTGLTPNIKGHPYFNIKNFDNYVSHLKENYDFIELNDDNYRINTNVVKISNENLTNKLFTYAIETDGQGWHRCYFINSITEQSKMLYLQLSIDYWGSYYLESNIDFLNITRCNRNIGIGVYDEIKNVQQYNKSGIVYTDGERFANLFQVVLVLQISYVTKAQTWIDKHGLQSSGLFFIPLQKFTPHEHFETLFEYVKEFVNGIYGIDSDRLIFPATNDAVCTKAFILPYELITDLGDIGGVTLKSKFAYYDEEDERTKTKDIKLDFLQISPAVQIKNINFEFDLNRDYIVGTPYTAGIKLTKFTNTNFYGSNYQFYRYLCKTSLGNLKVYIQQGENEKDITEAFELEITGKSEVPTAVEAVAENIKFLNSEVKSVSRGLESGGTAGAILGGFNEVAKRIPASNAQNNIQGTGGALVTFDFIEQAIRGNDYIAKPYVAMYYESTENEKLHARLYGASFNENYNGIAEVLTKELLGEGDYELTYLVAEEVRINNLPTDARNEIERQFLNGVELIDYEGTASE